MCLFPDNVALFSPLKTLLKSSLFNTYNFGLKRFPNVKEDRAKGVYVLSRVVGSLFVFNSVSIRCLCIV